MTALEVARRWAPLDARFAIAAAFLSAGLKPPLDYSVYSASACALLLALHEYDRPRRESHRE